MLKLTYVKMILKRQVSNSLLLCRVSSCSGGWSTVGFSLTGRRMAWIHSSVSSSNNPPPAKQQALHQGPWKEYKDENAVEKFVISWGRQGWKQHSQNEIYAKRSWKQTGCGNSEKDEVSSDWKVEESSALMFRMNRL